MSFTNGNPGGEQLDGFSNVVTNGSTGVAIGGSSTAGILLFCVLIYFLYRLLRPEPRIEPVPVVIPTRQCSSEAFTNQNGASCPSCSNATSSSPPAYDDVFPTGERICYMSAPPENSKQPTN